MSFTDIDGWAAKHGVSREAMRELFAMFEPAPKNDTSGTEAGVQSQLRVEAPRVGARLWRNNVGACQDDTGRLIRYGLGHSSKALNDVWKSSDLIGITPFSIGAADVGRVVGVFTAVEVKEPGWRGVRDKHEKAQAAFLATVAELGGIGMFATGTGDYRARIGR